MPIIYDSQNKTFKLDTATSSYIIKIYDENYILNLYYGAKIPDTYVPDRECLAPCASFSPANPVIGEHGFSPDSAPMEYGTNGAGDFRISALAIRNSNGDSVTDIRYTGHKIYKGKPEIPGQPSTYANSEDEAETLELYAEDAVTGLKITLYYTVFENYGVMTRRVRAENNGDGILELERIFSLCLNLPSMDYDLITLYGRHAKERNIERKALAHVSACDRTGDKTKGNVALWGTFGYELDPLKLTDSDREIIKEQVKLYHNTYDLIRNGDLYRLVSPFENPYRAVWEIVSPDKSRAMVTVVTMRGECAPHTIVKLRGLEPQRYYRNEKTGETYSGALLMNAGLNLTYTANNDGDSELLIFTAI